MRRSHVMKHPFFTGRNVERLPGQDPEFDAFLSYRVNADLAHVELLYNLLTARGVRVWWDKVCLEAGVVYYTILFYLFLI